MPEWVNLLQRQCLLTDKLKPHYLATTCLITVTNTLVYPPQSSLHTALQNQQQASSTSTSTASSTDSQQPTQQGAHACGHHHSSEEVETMRLKGGCFDLGLCGCPDCECCIIPCTIM